VIGHALLLTLADFLIASVTASFLFFCCCLYAAHQHEKLVKKVRAKRRLESELKAAELQREAAIRVRGPLPNVREWDSDHATRIHVGRDRA
jgi:hypothetical protein